MWRTALLWWARQAEPIRKGILFDLMARHVNDALVNEVTNALPPRAAVAFNDCLEAIREWA